MGAEIDRLEIEVQAQATKANNALDKMVGKLERLAGSVGSIKSDGLTEFASGESTSGEDDKMNFYRIKFVAYLSTAV